MPDYAIEADPGRCTASFPTYATEAEVRHAVGYLQRPDLPLIRVLRREDGGPWVALAGEDGVTC